MWRKKKKNTPKKQEQDFSQDIFTGIDPKILDGSFGMDGLNDLNQFNDLDKFNGEDFDEADLEADEDLLEELAILEGKKPVRRKNKQQQVLKKNTPIKKKKTRQKNTQQQQILSMEEINKNVLDLQQGSNSDEIDFNEEDLQDPELLKELEMVNGGKKGHKNQNLRTKTKSKAKTKTKTNPKKKKKKGQQILSMEEINKNVLDLQQGSDSDEIDFNEEDLQDPELLKELEMVNGGKIVQKKQKPKPKTKTKAKTKTKKQGERIATLKDLENIKIEWAKATMHYKQLQEEQKMVLMATGFRNLKALIERAKKGEKFLLEDVPRPNQSKKKKEKKNKQQKVQDESDDDSDEGFEKIELPKKKTTKKKPRKETKEEMNERIYSEMEMEIEKEIESLTKLEKAKLQVQDQKGANEITKKIKLLRKQLNMLQAQKLNKKSPPEFQYETSTFQQEFINSHLTEDEIEIVIVGGYDIRGNSPETLVEIIFPYPSSKPQKAETKPKKGNNPKFNFSKKFKISRKKTFFTFIQKKKIKFSLVEKGSWFKSNKAVGKVDIIPKELFTKTEAHYRVDLLNKRKKPIGSQIEIIIRLRVPCQGKDVRNITHRSIIINEYLENLGLKPKSKKPSSRQSKSSKSNKKNEMGNKNNEKRNKKNEKGINKKTNEKKKSEEQGATTKTTSTTTPTVKTNTTTDKKTQQNFDSNYGNPDIIENVISNDVLQDIIKDCDSKIQKYKQQQQKIPEIILEKKEFANQKINFLGQMVGSGKLTLEQYISQLKKEVENEKIIATNLAKMKKIEWAKAALRRKKIMEREIESAESIESESGDDDDEDEKMNKNENEKMKNEQKKQTQTKQSINNNNNNPKKETEKSKKETTTKTTKATTPTVKTNTTKDKKTQQKFDSNYGNPDIIENVISNDVLQDIIKDCDSKIQKYKQQQQKIPEIILEKKEFAEQKINFLGQMVGSGKLTLEQYVTQLKKEVENEKIIATNLAKMKKIEWAKSALRRKKIMEKEIESAESIESESGDEDDEDEKMNKNENEKMKNEQKKQTQTKQSINNNNNNPPEKETEKSKKETTTKTTSTTTPTVKTKRKTNINKTPKQNFDSNYGNPDIIENVISNDVLQDIIKDCDSKIQKYKQQQKKIPEIILEKKEFAEQKINFLGQMVGSGKLTLEQYVSQLKKEVENEKKVAINLAKMKKIEWAKAALRRKKIMEREIESAESIESESDDDEN
ncbi:hypothetical protein M0813_07541 [Anaeramoeba flamelloides]|uniref:C2 domain-containing protein n=1 Tax=Anaeramoeba flamelloides TaxID=1746091 RepID=A0ABQ8XA82_9EUKA|nr:hypothetical protein M0813_07541 [Anaeramoeba flamelloides]